MKAKLWERTAFRIIIFLLCAICASGAVCFALVGSGEMDRFFEKNDNRISFDGIDVISQTNFLESGSFRVTAREKAYDLMLLFLSDWNVDEGVVSGQGYEREVEDVLRNLYSEIKYAITDRVPSYSETYGGPDAYENDRPPVEDYDGGAEGYGGGAGYEGGDEGSGDYDGGAGYNDGGASATEDEPPALEGGYYDEGVSAPDYGRRTIEPPDDDGYTLVENWESYLYDAYYYWNGADEMYGSYDGYQNYDGRAIEFDLSTVMRDPVLFNDSKLASFGKPGVREAFEALFPEQIDYIKGCVKDNMLYGYNDRMKQLEGTYYYVSGGGKTLSNVPLYKTGLPVDPDRLTSGQAWIVRGSDRAMYSNPPGLMSGEMLSELGKAQLYLAFSDDVIAEYEGLFQEARGIVWLYFGGALALAILAIVFFVMSIANTGRARPSYGGERRLWAADRIFVEFQIALFIIIVIIGGLSFVVLVQEYTKAGFASQGIGDVYAAIIVAVVFVVVAALLWFLLSLVRVGKAGLFAERSLIGMFASGPCKELADAVKSGYDGRNPLAKTIILVALFWFLTALFAGVCGIALNGNIIEAAFISFLLLLVVLGGAIYFTRKWAERYGALRRGVEEIASGNLGCRIEITGDGKNEFDRLSAMVNELGSAQNAAIQNELKNQRLKTDLISNVSHDLKTPLTSILTYTDLLKTEGLKSKNAEEYLRIIDEKGKRLKKLTDDLFDAAKASSGAITVRKERVDLLALINQEIAEVNGGFSGAELELVINADEEHYYVEADSQLLWRVVDNLLRNVLKYAQAGTRVYIELKEYLPSRLARPEAAGGARQGGTDQGGAGLGGAPLMTTLEIKNMSATKLNIPPEELMERFKRGDEARATEGSGLGLAIAKDLVRLQGGWFEILIDGDLFKTIIMLPPYIGD